MDQERTLTDDEIETTPGESRSRWSVMDADEGDTTDTTDADDADSDADTTDAS